MVKFKNKKLQLITLNDYGDRILQFEFAQIIKSEVIDGVHFLSCRLADGRMHRLSTKFTVFIEELE